MRFAINRTILLVSFIFILGSSAHGEVKLSRDIPELCFTCHEQLKRDLSAQTVHIPFKDGKCLSCHNVHASKHKGLTAESSNELCYGCHKELKKKVFETRMHGAIKKGLCIDCHAPHASRHSALLVSEEKDICFNCHKELQEKISQDSRHHQPFTKGQCSSCHDSHASKEYNLLKSAPNRLCQQCHTPGCRVENVSIADRTKRMDCTGCHTGHSAREKGLLGPSGHPPFLEKNCYLCHKTYKEGKAFETITKDKELCFNCHSRDIVSIDDIHNSDENSCLNCHNVHASQRKKLIKPEDSTCLKCHEDIDKKINRMTKRLKTIRCVPVKDRRCADCHAPGHAKKPLYFKVESDIIKTCAECHKAQHERTHPIGEKAKDPRTGDPITCKTCHSFHNARAEFMLRFDRNRELCIQCHKL